MKKHKRYQDYVIKDGQLVGDFENMYKEVDDPWEQTVKGFASEKVIATTTLN